MRKEITANLFGLEVTGALITGDTMGDRDVTGGIQHLPPYTEDVRIQAPDGTDITDNVDGDMIRWAENAIIEEGTEE
jgi:hypothetical protein